jgi:predicted phage terminase large subunit-like protein
MIDKLTPSDRERLEALVQELKRRKHQELCRKSFLAFVKHMWPIFINGRHHMRIAHEFENIEQHKNGRLIINLGPRHTKSEFASVLLPAWYLGLHPDHKVIQCSVTAELAVGFGRRVRNMIDTPEYREIFPTVALQADSKAAGRWATNLGGNYFAIGVSGSVTGIGADLCVIPESSIITRRGTIQAQEIKLGDELLGLSGWNTVLKIISSSHSETVTLNDKLKVSTEHPVYIVEKGWIPAKDIKKKDKLLVVSSMGIIRVLYNQYRTYLNVTAQSVFHKRPKIRRKVGCLQHLGDDAPTLLQPQRSQLSPLWRAWHYRVRALEKFKELYRRYGPKTLKETHFGQDRWRGPLYAGELPVGGWRDTGQQPRQQYDDNRFWADFDDQPMGAQDRVDARYDSSPNRQYGDDAGAGVFRRADELESARGYSDGFDGQRDSALQNFGRSAQNLWKRGVRCGIGALKNLLWVHMEVRAITRETHGPRKFINFHVSGDNTFVCESSMVHNCIIDDPHDEQTALQAITTPEIYEKTYQWYESGPRQRLQPGGSLVIVMTRWSKMDLTAQLLDKAVITGGEQWKHISFPAILPSGKPLWPEFWSLGALEATRNAISLPKWNAQYLQQPTSDQAAIVKRTDWQRWPDETPPPIDFVLQTMDTAFEKNQRADYSAIATWGIFYRDDDVGLRQAHIILLDMVREKCQFPRLKQLVKEKYDEYQADKIIIEKKATGAPLIYELRSAGIPCSEFTPTRQTGDKTARLNAVTDLFASKRVWAPNRRFADELIEEVASFPNARNDDLCDVTAMALAYFRTGGFIRTDSDLPDEVKYFKSSKKMAYY